MDRKKVNQVLGNIMEAERENFEQVGWEDYDTAEGEIKKGSEEAKYLDEAWEDAVKAFLNTLRISKL